MYVCMYNTAYDYHQNFVKHEIYRSITISRNEILTLTKKKKKKRSNYIHFEMTFNNTLPPLAQIIKNHK